MPTKIRRSCESSSRVTPPPRGRSHFPTIRRMSRIWWRARIQSLEQTDEAIWLKKVEKEERLKVYFLVHVKGQSPHKQKLLSPTENTAPETPRSVVPPVIPWLVTMSYICVIHSYQLGWHIIIIMAQLLCSSQCWLRHVWADQSKCFRQRRSTVLLYKTLWEKLCVFWAFKLVNQF